MLEDIAAIPERIATLKRKLAAREGMKEFKESRKAIRAEIARLEGATQQPGGAVAFEGDQEQVT